MLLRDDEVENMEKILPFFRRSLRGTSAPRIFSAATECLLSVDILSISCAQKEREGDGVQIQIQKEVVVLISRSVSK